MRALGSSVLAFEVIVSLLFIPAALQESSAKTSTILVISLAQILLAIMAMGTLGKSYGILFRTSPINPRLTPSGFTSTKERSLTIFPSNLFNIYMLLRQA